MHFSAFKPGSGTAGNDPESNLDLTLEKKVDGDLPSENNGAGSDFKKS